MLLLLLAYLLFDGSIMMVALREENAGVKALATGSEESAERDNAAATVIALVKVNLMVLVASVVYDVSQC